MGIFNLYRKYRDRADGYNYWGIRVVSNTGAPGTVTTRWGVLSSNRLPQSKTFAGDREELIRQKLGKGYVSCGSFTISDETGEFASDPPEPTQTDSDAVESNPPDEPDYRIYWSVEPPRTLSDDDGLLVKLDEWLVTTLDSRIKKLGCSFDTESRELNLTPNCKISIGKGKTVDLCKRRCSGIIEPQETGPMPVLFLLALKRWFPEEQWRNSLTIAYGDSTVVGNEIRKDSKFFEHFDIDSIEDIRDEAEAFGLIQERVVFSSSIQSDWF